MKDFIKSHYFLALVLLAGCSSLHSKVYNNLHEGDDSDKIQQVLGTPDSFQPSVKIEGATAWYYRSGADICGLTVKDSKLKAMECRSDPNYIHPVMAGTGSVLKGIGDGLKQSSQNTPKTTTCSTNGATYGNSYSGSTYCTTP